MRKRVDQLGVSEPEIQRAGADQIEVGAARRQERPRAQQQVGKIAQLYFYDWEANVLGAERQAAPADANGHRRPARGLQLGLPEYQAVQARRQAAADRNPNDGTAAPASSTTCSTTRPRRCCAAPRKREQDLFAERLQAQPAQRRSVKVNPGTVARAGAARPATARSPARRTAGTCSTTTRSLDGHGHHEPPAELRQRRRWHGAPNVTFCFTARASKSSQNVTRDDRPARPGSAAARLATRKPRQQHFAVVARQRS